MDNAQIEQELEDLEAKMERLRALYEQYFLGLEKLEPTVLRKDVDRKLWVMRREQIRNTGLRFKFQMLIQRYNTYQQYWTRVVREIENGTFRRDVIKVAQRFGEKDMLTIVGKKRAEQYKRLARNQEDRRSRRKGKVAEQDEAAAKAHDDAIELHDHEIELVEDEHEDIELVEDTDDEASTIPKDVDAHRLPPPTVDVPKQRPQSPTKTPAHDPKSEAPLPAHESKHAHHEPDMEALLQLATVGVKEWSGRAGKPTIDGKGAPPFAATMPSPKMMSAPPAEVPALPPTGFGEIPISISEPGFGEIPISASPPEPVKSGQVPPPRGSSSGVASAASKSRVAELAAQMRAKKEAAKPKADPLELDGLLDSPAERPAAPAISQKPVAPAISQKQAVPSIPQRPVVPSIPQRPIVPAAPIASAPPPAQTTTSAPPPTPDPTTLPEGTAPAKPKADRTPIPIPSLPPTQNSAQPRVVTSPFPRPASATSMPGGVPSASRGAASLGAPATAAPKTAVSAGQTAPAASASGDLSEQKMREIYVKYVGAKRAANESTAGLTYDKLANSLRAQAEKLHAAHPSRTVDFEVVTKDGKTALRPIVK